MCTVENWTFNLAVKEYVWTLAITGQRNSVPQIAQLVWRLFLPPFRPLQHLLTDLLDMG